jgi:hypothetical protein
MNNWREIKKARQIRRHLGVDRPRPRTWGVAILQGAICMAIGAGLFWLAWKAF